MLKNYSSPVWTKEINFYLDDTSFQHKFYPKDQARGPHQRECWHPNEGFKKDCTWKGAQLGSGGRVAHLIVSFVLKKWQRLTIIFTKITNFSVTLISVKIAG